MKVCFKPINQGCDNLISNDTVLLFLTNCHFVLESKTLQTTSSTQLKINTDTMIPPADGFQRLQNNR